MSNIRKLLHGLDLLLQLIHLLLALLIHYLCFMLCLLSLFRLFLGPGLRLFHLLLVHIGCLLRVQIDYLICASAGAGGQGFYLGEVTTWLGGNGRSGRSLVG